MAGRFYSDYVVICMVSHLRMFARRMLMFGNVVFDSVEMNYVV